jgi:uridine kinase
MILIGIAGGSGSGKTRFAEALAMALNPSLCTLVPQDAYYIDRAHVPPEERRLINFDKPSAIDFTLLYDHIFSLKRGMLVERPVYSYASSTRERETVGLRPLPYLILEGLFALNDPRIRQLLNLKIFLDVPYSQRYIRTCHRDIRERGKTAEEVKERFENVVEPMHRLFVEPERQFANLVIQNQVIEVGIEKVLHHINEIRKK